MAINIGGGQLVSPEFAERLHTTRTTLATADATSSWNNLGELQKSGAIIFSDKKKIAKKNVIEQGYRGLRGDSSKAVSAVATKVVVAAAKASSGFKVKPISGHVPGG